MQKRRAKGGRRGSALAQRKKHAVAWCATIGAVWCGRCLGQTTIVYYTYPGYLQDSWNYASSWSDEAVPTSLDSAIIGDDTLAEPYINPATGSETDTVADLSFMNTATPTLSIGTGGTLDVIGSIFTQSASIGRYINGGGTTFCSQISGAITLEVTAGQMYSTSAALTNSLTSLQLSGSGEASFAGPLDAGTWTMSGGGTLVMFGQLTVSGTGNVPVTGGQLSLGDGLLDNGPLSLNTTTIAQVTGGTVTVPQITLGGSSVLTMSGGILTMPSNGLISMSGGTLDLFGSNQTIPNLSGSQGVIDDVSAGGNITLTCNGSNTSTFYGVKPSL